MTLARMREIVAAMRLPEGWAGGIDEMNEVVFLLADIAGIDAPDVDLDAMTERALAVKAVNSDRMAGAVAFLRATFYNDGAEGESVHRVCADAEALAAREHPAAVLSLLARLRRAEAIGKAERELRKAREPHSLRDDDAQRRAAGQRINDACADLRALGVEP